MAVTLLLASAATGHGAPRSERDHLHPVPETGQPGLLRLTSSVLPLEIPWLQPGDSFSWQIGLHLEGQPLADASLEFVPYGGLVNPAAGYLLTARRCDMPWTGNSGTNKQLTCRSGARAVLSEAPLLTGSTTRIPLGDVAASAAPHILLTLSLPHDGLPRDPFTFAVSFTVLGAGDPAGQQDLAETGSRALGSLTAAAILLAAGLLMTLRGRRRNTL